MINIWFFIFNIRLALAHNGELKTIILVTITIIAVSSVFIGKLIPLKISLKLKIKVLIQKIYKIYI